MLVQAGGHSAAGGSITDPRGKPDHRMMDRPPHRHPTITNSSSRMDHQDKQEGKASADIIIDVALIVIVKAKGGVAEAGAAWEGVVVGGEATGVEQRIRA